MRQCLPRQAVTHGSSTVLRKTQVLGLDDKLLIFECTALASLRSRYASLFTDTAGTMRSFFAQPDHVGVFHYVVDCLDFMMI